MALGLGGLVFAALLTTTSPQSFFASAHATLESAAAPSAQTAPTAPPSINLVDQAPAQADVPAAALQGGPERRLIAAYKLIAAGQHEQALAAVEALVQSHPKFKLAQLLYADLLITRTGKASAFGSALVAQKPQVQHDADTLREEALLRLRSLQARPPKHAVPSEFIALPPSVRYAIAVDTSRARLYLFEHVGNRLTLADDFYISVGKQGVDKLVEGDQKTPLGVYFTTGQLDPRSLQERFGSGALPLNYPNAFDKLKGRTGSGILLHGVSSSTYSRPPLDSDGCVAMANDDLQRLVSRLPQRDTPVVITRSINWVPADSTTAKAPEALDKAIKRWQAARLSNDLGALRGLYDLDEPGDTAASGVANWRQNLGKAPSAIDEVSVLTWFDDRLTMVVTFREIGSGPKGADRLMRQYWSQQGDQWHIVAEGPVH